MDFQKGNAMVSLNAFNGKVLHSGLVQLEHAVANSSAKFILDVRVQTLEQAMAVRDTLAESDSAG